MTANTVVVAIGGNALSPSGESAEVRNQFLHTRESLVPIVAFAREGWQIAIVHGNGPQVGDALLRNECARSRVEELPMGVLVPATAGWIGYMIQQSLQNALARDQIDRRVITVITQTLVDPADPAFANPTKPVGRALSPEVAAELRSEGVTIGEDSRGNLRRMVASPLPVGIPEASTVADLMAAGDIVIACGSGGAPAHYDPDLGLEGVDVIVDKDWAASILAEQVAARVLLILTDVAGVYDDFGGPDQRLVERVTAREAQERLSADGLGAGSMRPKLAAATHFVERTGGSAVIAALDDGLEALQGRAGTWIVRH